MQCFCRTRCNGKKDFLKDDILIMNSDGLSNLVSQEDMFREAKKDIEQAPKQLVKLANENGGYDNITVIIIKIYNVLLK